MKQSIDVERKFVNGQSYPPKSQKGRPTERPHSPGLHRSSSRASRTSTRSKRRYEDMLETEKNTDDLRVAVPQSLVQRLKNKVSSITQQPSPSVGKNLGSPGRESIDSIQKSLEIVVYNKPRGPRSPVGQPSQPVAKVTNTTHISVSHDHEANKQIPSKVPCPSSNPSAGEPDANVVREPQTPQLEKSKELPPTPPPHESQPKIPPRVESKSDEQNDLKVVLNQQQMVIDDLDAKREALSQQVQDLNQQIAHWKNRTSEAASKSGNVLAETPLSRPESELLKDWRNLAFDVRNFVTSHFEKVSTSKLESWTKENGEWLRGITPMYQHLVMGKRSGLAIIEAAIWYCLASLVFGGVRGNGPMRWAGDYQKTLRRMINELYKGRTQQNAEQFTPLFHQWGALTANVIATAQADDYHDQQVHLVIEEFEDLFAHCRSRVFKSDTYRRDLRALIYKAIVLDLKLSGQTVQYLIDWPPVGRCNVAFDQITMQWAPRSPQTSRNVRFMLQPCLFRCCGQNEGYNSLVVIDPCVVWMS